MKKGFTLIELLAVIVILAIIALIATPIVLDIIKDSKKSAQIESAKFYINAVEQSIALSKLNNQSKVNVTYLIMGNGNLCEGMLENNVCEGNEIKLEVKGEVPKIGSIAIKNGDMSLAISNGGYCIIKSFSDSNITVYENGNSCLLPGTAVVNGESQLTLHNSNGQNLTNYKIYGNSVQNGIPTPEAPIEVESVGDYDEETGKYKIPVKVSNGTDEVITNIYLNEPLRKIGDYADYIDFENKKVVRLVAEKILDGSESWNKIDTEGYNRYLFDLTNTAEAEGSYSLCNKLVYSSYNRKDNSFVIWSGGNVLYTRHDSSTSVDEWKEYLANNNGIKLTYPLETPTEETIELPNIPTLKGTTILEVDTTIKPSNVEITY